MASDVSAQACITATTGSLTYNGVSFLDRPTPYYTAGEVVEICFSLDDQFQTPDSEWVHGIFVTSAGGGFDFSTMAPSGTPPAACRAGGNWKYYDSWSRCHTNCGETTFFNGYGFDSAEGLRDCPSPAGGVDGDPGNNFGDGGGNCGLVFCWTFEAVDAGGLGPAEAYGIEVRVTADGVSGSYESGNGPCVSPCDNDPQICFPEIPEPTVEVLNEPCPGDLFELQGNPVTPGVDATWFDSDGNVVATDYFAILPEGTYTLSLARPNCAPREFEIEVALQIPVLEYTGPDDGTFFCYGESFDLAITVTNADVNFIEWILDGNVVGNGESYSVSEATPDDAGEYTVSVNYGDNCTAEFMTTILVGDNPSPLITTDPADGGVCEGQPITFTAVRADGSPFPNDWVLSWSSPAGGGEGSPLTIDMAFGAGDQIMTLDIIDSDGCPSSFEHPFVIYQLPTAEIFPEFNNICRGESITLTPTIFSGEEPMTYRWGPAYDVTTLTYTVEPPYNTQLVGVWLEMTDANGCIGESNYADIIINDLPDEPEISCDPICVSELRFDWTSRGADYYEVYARINGEDEVLVVDDYTETFYLFTGLNADDRVRLRVVPFSGVPGAGCAGPEERLACRTPLVSSPGFIVDYEAPFCTDGTGGQLPLFVSAQDPGVFTFNSTDLGLTDLAADPSDTTLIPLPALPADTNAFSYQIEVSYINDMGSCPADTSIIVTVVRAPDPGFTLDALTACGTSASFTASLSAAPTTTDSYVLQLADPGVGTVTDNGSGSWAIDVTATGTHELVLVTTNALSPNCTDTARAELTLSAPPPPPVVECGLTGLDFVTFSWGDSGHDSYVVNEIMVPAGGVVTQTGTTARVTGLSVDDMVTISVTGVTAGCPNVTSEEVTCVAESCPDITLAVTPIPDFCVNDPNDLTVTFTAEGSDSSGVAQFLLDGVPSGATLAAGSLAPGTYVVRVNFEEGCSFFATDTFTVHPEPSAVFTLPDGPICINETILGATAGAEIVGGTYRWSTDNNATITPGADQSELNFSWPTPGRYYVSLEVENEFGCLSTVETDSIDVVAPLLVPAVTCDTVAMEFVVFTWPAQTRADSFGVSVNGGPLFFQDSTTLYVGGLAVDSTVTVEVTAFGEVPCPAAGAGSASCTSVPCPALVVSRPDDVTLCADYDASRRTLLTTTVTGDNGGGTLSFSGPGVIRVGDDYFFDTDTAGVGEHLLQVDFVEGQCFGRQNFTYTVVERPDGEILINGQIGPINLCVGDPFTLEYSGNISASDSATFCWVFTGQQPEFDGPEVPFDTVGFERYVCRFREPGPFDVCLVIKTRNCESDSIKFGGGICELPPPPPTIVCQQTELNSVTFAWGPGPNTSGYTILRDGFPPEFTTATSVTYSGLEPGTSVTISVIAESDNVCGPSFPSNELTCRTEDCPPLELDFSSLPSEVCILNGDEAIPLSDLVVTGGTGNGTLSFSGVGVARDTFFASQVDFNETGATYTITAEYVEEGPCTLIETFAITVFERPTAFLTDPGAQCLGDTMRVTVGSTNFVANDDITIEWDGGTVVADGDPDDAVYLVTYATPGVKNITATVISNISGCPSEEALLTVEVITPLTAPVLECTEQELEQITFSWAPVAGATGYRFVYESTTLDLPPSATSQVIDGLAPDQTVSFSLQALGDAPCGNGPVATAECTSLACPPGVVQPLTSSTDICLDGTESPLPLNATLTEGIPAGPISWSGTGVITNPDGSQSFNPVGLPAGDYVLSVAYDGPSSCDSRAEITLRLIDQPIVGISDTPDRICVGQSLTVAYEGNAPTTATYEWNFGDATVTDLGDERYQLTWLTPGNKTVSLLVTDDCADGATFSIEVDPTLAAPQPTCTEPTRLDGVTFTWPPVAGAESYRYSINGDDFVTTTQLSVEVNDLDFGEAATVVVVALRTGTTCNESPASEAVTCTARTCPVISLNPAIGQSTFCADESGTTPLSTTPVGDDGTGVTVWTGAGVVDTGNGFAFDPTAVGLGRHTLYVTYVQELLCEYRDSLEVEIFPLPVVAFNAIPAQLCEGQEFNVFFTGTAAENATYNWDFDGAVVTDLGDESYVLRWDTPGDKTVTLTVEDNCMTTESFTIPVTPTLAAPLPVCSRQDLDGVLFTWSPVAAASEGYRVSLNGQPYGAVQTDTTFYVGDLDFGQSVSIRVVSVRTGTTCDESGPSAEIGCAARRCPPVTLAPAAAQTAFCSAAEAEPVALLANLTGDDGNGVVAWTGNGVRQQNGTWVFDPGAAGVGVHTLSVTYTQELLCTYAGEMEMTVTATPEVSFAPTAAVTCAQTAQDIQVQVDTRTGTTYAYDWDGGVATEVSPGNFTLVFAEAGDYLITTTAERNGCVSMASRELSIEAIPSAGTPLAGLVEICEGADTPVLLSDRLTGASPGGTWRAVSGSVPNGILDDRSGVLQPGILNPGNYTFRYEVGGQACPMVSAEVSLSVLGAPVADAGPNQTLTCTMGMVSLDGSNSETGAGYTYLWIGPDEAADIMGADQMMIDVGQPGTYQLLVTNAIGCTAVSEVLVAAETEAPVMELEVSQITCFASDNGAISVTSISGGRPPYTFLLNGQERGASTLFTGLAPAEYDVQITDANGCFSNILLDISQPDELRVRLNFPGDSTEVNAGDDVFITASVTGGNTIDTLIWRPDSLASSEGRNGISFTASETQMISVTVVDELGCSATDRQMLLVRRDRPVYFPTAFSPNGDNTNDVYFIGGDLDQIVAIRDFKIFDRWGELLYDAQINTADGLGTGGGAGAGFLPNDPAFGWDGTLDGREMNPQVCIYTATVEFTDGEVIVYKGDFVLMR